MSKKRDWDKVADERCECGCLKSVHAGILRCGECLVCGTAKAANQKICIRYTWKEFVDKNGEKVA